MNAKRIWRILGIIVLVGISVFTSIHYYTLLDQNRILQKLVIGYEKKLNDLEASKKAMEEQLALEKETLDLQLRKTKVELKQVTDELSATRDKVGVLEKTNLNLLEAQNELRGKVDQIARDKETLAAKFNSLEALKRAIRDLKIKIRQQRLTGKLEKEEKQLSEGNKGYILFQGMSTARGKVKIEVTPVP